MKALKTYKTTGCTLLLLLFTIISTFPAIAQEKEKTADRKYVKVEVDGLACPFCAYGLEKKLKKIKGAKNLFIELNEGYATFDVPDDSPLTEEDIKKIVADAGFEARKITFSDKPFPEPASSKEKDAK